MIKAKPLPRDEHGKFLNSFEANGRKYYIWSPDDLGIVRMIELQKMSTVMGFGMSLLDIYENLKKTEELINGCAVGKAQYVELALHNTAMLQGISEGSNDRYNKIMRYCCIFILRENEDFRTIIEAEQEDKIDDWVKEGYKGIDFFLLAVTLTHGYQMIIEEVTGKPMEEYLGDLESILNETPLSTFGTK